MWAYQNQERNNCTPMNCHLQKDNPQLGCPCQRSGQWLFEAANCQRVEHLTRLREYHLMLLRSAANRIRLWQPGTDFRAGRSSGPCTCTSSIFFSSCWRGIPWPAGNAAGRQKPQIDQRYLVSELCLIECTPRLCQYGWSSGLQLQLSWCIRNWQEFNIDVS